MSTFTTIMVALKALRRNPTRALLTTLGIVIGISAVITMMEIGNGSSTAIRQSIESMGTNTLVVMPGTPRPPGGVMQAAGTAMSLTPDDCDAIRRECMNVAYVSPIVSTSSSQLVFGGKNWTAQQIMGVNNDYLKIRSWNVSDGRTFSEEEITHGGRVCLVGQTIVNELFGGASPVGSTMRVKNVTFQIVGVLEKKGANMMGRDEDDIVVAPWTTIRSRITGLKKGSASNTTSTASTLPSDLYPATGVAFYPEQSENLESDTLLIPKFVQIDQIMIGATASETVNAASNEIETLLRERHELKDGAENDFWIRNSAEFMKTLSSTTTMMSNLLLVVALISLIVGGVGIMNIMLVSVTERTREIGLRMAVGARARDILKQFLIESVMLCLVGGLVGILLGHGAALLVNSKLGWPIESSSTVVMAAFFVSAMVGMVFGFYPAWKASRLDPIEALRYE